MSQQIITSLATNIRSTCQSALIEFDWTFHLLCSLKQWMNRAALSTEWLWWDEVRWLVRGYDPGVAWSHLMSDSFSVLCSVCSVQQWLCISLSQSVVCNWAVLALEHHCCRTGPLCPLSQPHFTTSVCLPSAPTLRNILTNKLSLYISLLCRC